MTALRPEESAFPPHGRTEVHPHGRVVYFEATGPFNAEAVAVMQKAYTPIMATMAADGPFGHISTFHESMLATPEAFDAFAALLDGWCNAGILPAVNAYVIARDVEGRNLLLPRYAAAFPATCRFSAFEQPADAEAWVARELSALR